MPRWCRGQASRPFEPGTRVRIPAGALCKMTKTKAKAKNNKQKQQTKKVIVVIGTIGSGKSLASKYIARRFGFKHITMSNILRGIAKTRGIKPTRQNLEKLQAKLHKKDKYFLIDRVIEKIMKSSKQKFVVDGARHPEQVEKPKKLLNAFVLLIDADPKIRFERIKARKRRGDPKTFDEFLQLEQKENKIFRFNKTKKYADAILLNNSTKQSLFKQIDKIMKKLIKEK